MTVFSLLRDAWFFYRRHLGLVLGLCIPLIVLESLTRQVLLHWSTEQTLPIQDLVAGLLFYPLYTAALIKLMDARNQNQQPSHRELLAQALQCWWPLAVLVGFTSSLIILGGALYVLPGIWVMVKASLSEYLLVQRGLSPLEALRDSFILTRGRFWLILNCVLITLAPLMLLDLLSAHYIAAHENPLWTTLADAALGLAQCYTTVLFFRLYMQIVPPVAP